MLTDFVGRQPWIEPGHDGVTTTFVQAANRWIIVKPLAMNICLWSGFALWLWQRTKVTLSMPNFPIAALSIPNRDRPFLGGSRGQAVETLSRGLQDQEILLLLNGAAGTGKSVVLAAVLTTLGNEPVRVVHLTNPGARAWCRPDLVSQILARSIDASIEDSVKAAIAELAMTTTDAVRVVIAVDDAQTLTDDAMDFLLRLASPVHGGTLPRQLILTGRGAFWERPHQTQWRPITRLAQRVTLEPLDGIDATDFVASRLTLAGGRVDASTAQAVREISRYSGGLPDEINRIVATSIAIAGCRRSRVLTGDIVEAAVASLAPAPLWLSSEQPWTSAIATSDADPGVVARSTVSSQSRWDQATPASGQLDAVPPATAASALPALAVAPTRPLEPSRRNRVAAALAITLILSGPALLLPEPRSLFAKAIHATWPPGSVFGRTIANAPSVAPFSGPAVTIVPAVPVPAISAAVVDQPSFMPGAGLAAESPAATLTAARPTRDLGVNQQAQSPTIQPAGAADSGAMPATPAVSVAVAPDPADATTDERPRATDLAGTAVVAHSPASPTPAAADEPPRAPEVAAIRDDVTASAKGMPSARLNPAPAMPRPNEPALSPVLAGAARPEIEATLVGMAPPSEPTLPALTPAPSPDMVSVMLRLGEVMLRLGDIRSARLIFERAALAGSAEAASGAGKTYDPAFLAAVADPGVTSDVTRAIAWYRSASAVLGDTETLRRLKALTAR